MRLPLAVVSVVASVLVGAPLAAQDSRVLLDLVLPAQPSIGGEGPSVVVANLLADGKTREWLGNGWPAALHFRVELWRKSGWFDDPAGTTEWNFLVNYDPASQLYRVVRQQGGSNTQLEDFGECPQKFFFKHILHVEEYDDPDRELQMHHREKGKLDHTILERFYKSGATPDRIDAIVPPGRTVNPADSGWTPPALADPALRRRRP